MKTLVKILMLLVVLALLAFTPPAVTPLANPALPAAGTALLAAKAASLWQSPVPGPDDKLVLGGIYTLESGETLKGSLMVLGGMATLQNDSTVKGDVLVLGGTLQVDGTVRGDVNVVGGLVTLGDSAVVKGDVNTLSGSLQKADGARVDGKVNENVAGVYPFLFSKGFVVPVAPRSSSAPNPPIVSGQIPFLGVSLNPLWDFMWIMFRSFLWALLAVLVTLFAPQATQRAGQAGVGQAPASGCIGCLTMLLAPLALIVLIITLCGIPIALVLGFLLLAAWAFGVVSLGLETGERLAMALSQDWAPAASAGLGTFALTLVMNGAALIPCIGWIAPLLVGAVGLGAALLTRFGSRPYPQMANLFTPATPVAPYGAVTPAAGYEPTAEPSGPAMAAAPDEPAAPAEAPGVVDAGPDLPPEQ
jgi:hypothetical protein